MKKRILSLLLALVLCLSLLPTAVFAAGKDVYEIFYESRNQTITSGGTKSEAKFSSGWTSSVIGSKSTVQSIKWSISDSSVADLMKTSSSSTESYGTSSAIVLARPDVTKDTRVTVSVTITYTYDGSTYTASDSTSLTVEAREIGADKPELTLSPTSVNLSVGEEATITATLTGVEDYSKYRMNWRNVYDAGYTELCFTASGITKEDYESGNSSFDSRGHATITITGSKAGWDYIYPTLQTKAGNRVDCYGNDRSNSITVTVSGDDSSGGNSGGSSGGNSGGGGSTNTWWPSEDDDDIVTVDFYSNGGSYEYDIDVIYGEPYGHLPTPTRDGYRFDGWYTSRYGGDEVTSSTIVSKSYDHTLYAHWTELDEVTVYFDSNGGSYVSSKNVYADGKYGTLPTPTREGYIFDGWYTSSSGGSRVTSSTTVYDEYDHTLYAHWTQADSKVSVSPSSVSFDKAKEGYTQPSAKTVTVKNTGNVELTLSQPTSSNFDLGTLSKTRLSSNDSATFTVRPKAGLKAGTYSETITVKSTDGKTSETVSVSFTVEGEKQETKSSFTDVADPKAFYYDPVMWAVEKGVTSGTGANKFSPDATCTRGQVVTFLYRATGAKPVSSSSPFKDVANSKDYYYDPVLWAVANSITAGTSSTAFSPNAACTRGQVVTFLWRASGMPEPKSSTSKFTDVQDSSAYYYKAVLWAVENGITSGTSSTTFSPNDACTRGQIVTFLYRAYK